VFSDGCVPAFADNAPTGSRHVRAIRTVVAIRDWAVLSIGPISRSTTNAAGEGPVGVASPLDSSNRLPASEPVTPFLGFELRRLRIVEKRPHDGRETLRVRMMGEMAGALENLKATSRHRSSCQVALVDWDDGVVRSPQQQSGHALGEVRTVEHRDHLTPPVDARAKRAEDGSSGCGVGKRVEHLEDLFGVASKIRTHDTKHLSGDPGAELEHR
jgi:hypothetical protein